MRKQINGLVIIIEQQMEANVFEPSLFLFCNGERRILKAIYWDRTGFCLWQKRLEKHRFPWPRNDEQAGASASLYSIIETAKANRREPYWYLRELFEKLPHARTEADILELASFRITNV